MTINQLMAAADTSLGLNPLTLDGNSHRASQEQLKNWLEPVGTTMPGVPVAEPPCTYSFDLAPSPSPKGRPRHAGPFFLQSRR